MNSQYNIYKELIEDHLKDFLPNVDQKSITLLESMEYSLMSGGKRLRPVLLLAACDFCGGNINSALPYAVALEYIHTYSLIHDDLPAMDNDNMRRGRATNHMVYGDAVAILAGDGLLNSAFEVIFKDMFLSFDREDILKRKVRAANAIASGAGCKGMIAGQVSDIESEDKIYSKKMLEYIHINKTGELIRVALVSGAFIAGGLKDDIEALEEYGEYIGLAFQIADDILDVRGNPDNMGKNKNVDKKKCTYCKMYGLEKSIERLHELTETAKNIMKPFNERGTFFIELADELAKREK